MEFERKSRGAEEGPFERKAKANDYKEDSSEEGERQNRLNESTNSTEIIQKRKKRLRTRSKDRTGAGNFQKVASRDQISAKIERSIDYQGRSDADEIDPGEAPESTVPIKPEQSNDYTEQV